MRILMVLAAAAVLSVLATKPWSHSVQRTTHQLEITLDPTTGAFNATDVLRTSAADVRIETREWVEVEEVTLGGRTLTLTDDDNLLIPDLDDKALRVALSGVLPKQSAQLASFSHSADGSYLVGDTGWLPFVPRARASFQVRVTVPDTHRAVVTGNLVSEDVSDGTYTATFSYVGDANGLGIFIGPYQVAERDLGDISIRTYFKAENAGLADAYLDASADHIRRYEAAIGDYPYENFSVVSAPIPVGLGFSGMTYVSDRILTHPYMRGRSLAHEVLHNWWGNGVDIDISEGNWAEGLTTYQADYALAVENGPEAARQMRQDWLMGLAALSADQRQSIADFRSASHDKDQSVGYGKAALVFHMLEQEVGTAVFNAGLRLFWAEQKGRFASWGDLQVAMETTSDRDLTWFFDQWLMRDDLPEVKLTRTEVLDSADGVTVRLTLAQTTRPYRLRVPVHFGPAAEVVYVTLTQAEQTFDIPLSEVPEAISIDPEFRVARMLLPGEVPPSFRDFFSADAPRLILPRSERAFEAQGTLLYRRLVRRDPPAQSRDGLNTVVIGATQAVIDERDSLLPGSAPAMASHGNSRAWIERDPDGSTYTFLSADDPATLLTDLGSLFYYGNRGFAAFTKGRAVEAGRWQVEESPMTVKF